MQRASAHNNGMVFNCFKNAQAQSLYGVLFELKRNPLTEEPLAPSVSHSAAVSMSCKNTNCPFSGCFHFPRLSRLVNPTISSLKLYRHSHVVIEEEGGEKKASCLKMSRVEFDQFQRMCQESWKSLPRLTRVVRAATDY